MVKLLQFHPLVGSEPGAAQADRIQTADRIRARGDAEGRQILSDLGAALHDRQCADARELMHQRVAGDEHPVLHRDVACQQRAIRQNDMIAHRAIVRDVRVGHDEIIGADHRGVFNFRGAIDGGVFAKDVVIADDQARRFVFVFQILRRIANDTASMKFIARTDLRHAGEIRVRPHNTIRAQLHGGINDSEGTDADIGAEFRLRVDGSGRMNHFQPQVNTDNLG